MLRQWKVLKMYVFLYMNPNWLLFPHGNVMLKQWATGPVKRRSWDKVAYAVWQEFDSSSFRAPSPSGGDLQALQCIWIWYPSHLPAENSTKTQSSEKEPFLFRLDAEETSCMVSLANDTQIVSSAMRYFKAIIGQWLETNADYRMK